MNARHCFQICRAAMPLVAASALVACGIDLQSYGEPFFDLARDAGVHDAAVQPSDSAGSSAEDGRTAPVKNAADGGTIAGDGAADASDSEDAGVSENASVPHAPVGAGRHR